MFDLKPFSEPSIEDYRELICHPAVTRHMPLAKSEYSNEWIKEWITKKESTWPDKEFGPWSVWHDATFVGWVGLEPEGEDLSVGIVLHKKYWGSGKVVLKQVFTKIARKIKGKRVMVEFPKSRQSELWASRLGLCEIDEIELLGHVFVRYELRIPL